MSRLTLSPLLLSVLVLVGCGSGSGPPTAVRPTTTPTTASGSGTATPTDSPTAPTASAAAAELCPIAADAPGAVTFRAANGATLGGLTRGRGSVGVVLAHQSDGDLCQWWPYVQELAARGFRVLAFDFEGYGRSTSAANPADALSLDVRAAQARLRAAGANRIVLIGASMGGTAVLAAAAHADPGLAGVVSLSGPRSFVGNDALGAVPKIRVPVVFAAGEFDQGFATDARAMYARATVADKQLLVVPGSSSHGVVLVAPGEADQVRAAIFKLLDRVRR